MNSSPELERGTVLRGAAAARVPAARFDTDLRTHRFLRRGHDPRLLDPSLEHAFGEATAQARASAEAQGYTAGYAAGCAAAAETAAVETEYARLAADRAVRTRLELLDRAVAALTDAATTMARAAVPAYAEAADHLGPAAMEIVEALLGRELELAPLSIMESVRRALLAAPSDATVTMHLNPDDAATVMELHPDLDIELGRPVRVVADAGVRPGSAVAVHDAAHIEVCLSSSLERVRRELDAI
jgi:flagellar assembly protein FliH